MIFTLGKRTLYGHRPRVSSHVILGFDW